MNFPYIAHLSDIVPFIEANPQFRIQEQPNGTTVICYMLQDEDTFKGENEAYAQECRGIAFDTTSGKILSRTLHKFENVGQSDRSQPDQIPWSRIVRVMDKRDGSMITCVLVNGDVLCKTKKTFTSNEAIAATEFLHKDPLRVEWVRAMLLNDYTPTFEWTSPRFPIVLTYKKDELTLLHVRENKSGAYMSEDMMKMMLPMANPNLFPIVENLIDEFSWVMGGEDSGLPLTKEIDYKMLEKAQLEREGIEGWIVQADDGRMWKIKTKWYVDLHHSVTFTRWRDVARTVLEDKADDLKAAFAMTGRSIEPIIEVERKIHAEIAEWHRQVHEIVVAARTENVSAKELAIGAMGHPLFGQIMRVFRGGEVNWYALYLKDYIREWSLDVIPTAVHNEDVEIVVGEET